MTERDRLAADIASIRFGVNIEHPSQYEYDWADRLIALGWTRRPESVRDAAERLGIPTTDHGLPPDVVRPAPFRDDRDTLDEERLARAVHAAYHGDYAPPRGSMSASLDWSVEWYDSPRSMAAAIAKAYREDEG